VSLPASISPAPVHRVRTMSGSWSTVRVAECTVLLGLAHANDVKLQSGREGIDADALSAVIPGATIYIPFGDLIDRNKEIERLTKEKNRLIGELKRCEGMLGNERFLAKAPEAKVQEEKDKLEKYRQMMEQVETRLAQLRK
jgi:valyl-tRNA synthetase